jgi:Tfp pilus assembly protein PilF
VTAATAEAAAHYADFLDRDLAAAGGAAEALQRALAADPELALAHAAQAVLYLTAGDLAAARASAARAAALAAGATPREQGYVAAVTALLAGAGQEAVALLRGHLERYPRDIGAVQLAALLIASGAGGNADPGGARLDLLEGLAPAYGEDWAFLTFRGFALNEVGQHDRARALIDRALAGNPRSGAAAHAAAHVAYETGDPANGAAFLDAWLPGYPKDAFFFVHNHWHLSVFELQLGHFRRALAAYRTGVSPDAERAGPVGLVGTGAAALLWRAYLAGHPLEALPWGPVRAYMDRAGPRLGVFFRPLWDSFVALAYAATGDATGLSALEARLAAADPVAYPQAVPIVLPLAGAVWALAHGEATAAANALAPLAPALVRLGGSNEQRDTFDDTVVAALVHAGQHGAAEAHLRARLRRRPAAQDSLWLGQVLAATGRHQEAAEHARRAAAGWATADPEGPEQCALRHLQAAVERATAPADGQRAGRLPRHQGSPPWE